MEVTLDPALEAKLIRLAEQQGRDAQLLVLEAVERLVDYDEWFLEQVEIGVDAADRGELVEHDQVIRLLSDRYRE